MSYVNGFNTQLSPYMCLVDVVLSNRIAESHSGAYGCSIGDVSSPGYRTWTGVWDGVTPNTDTYEIGNVAECDTPGATFTIDVVHSWIAPGPVCYTETERLWVTAPAADGSGGTYGTGDPPGGTSIGQSPVEDAPSSPRSGNAGGSYDGGRRRWQVRAYRLTKSATPNRFDSYTPGSIVGQPWEGGSSGTGAWSAQTTGGYTQNAPSIIADPTGDGRGQVLRLEALGDNTNYAEACIFTPPADLYAAGNHVITIEWDQWRPNLQSSVRIQEGSGGNGVPAWVSYQYGYDGTLYPTGVVSDAGFALTASQWQHVKMVVDLDAATVAATVDGVAPSTDPQSITLGSDGAAFGSLCIRQYATNLNGAGLDYILIDNLTITGMTDASTGSGSGVWERLLNELPTLKVCEAKFAHRRDGGMSQLDFSFPLPIGQECTLIPNDRVSVWVFEDSVGWIEWWRGYYQSGRHSAARPDTFAGTAYGAIERMKGIYVDRQYAMAQQDLSLLFSQLLIDYALPWYTQMGFPPPQTDIQVIGITVGETRQLQGDLATVLNGLVSGVPGVTWGVDLDGLGNERIYLRPRPDTAKYQAFYGKDVASLEFGTEAADIVNALTIEGGVPLYPNLVPNGGFEKPSNEGANIILNPSFEDVQADDAKTAIHWDRISGDPTDKNNDTRTSDDSLSAASGSHYMEFDNNGGLEQIQGDPVAVNAGERFTFRVNMAAESSNHGCTPSIWLRAWDSGAAELATIPISGPSGSPNAWTKKDQAWQLYEYQFTMPAGAATVAVCISLPSTGADGQSQGGTGRGIGIDDVTLFTSDSMTQEGWVVSTNDTTAGLPSSVASVDAAVRDADTPQGAYSVRVSFSTGNDANCYAGLQTAPAITIGKNVECRLSFWAKAGAAAAVDLDVILWEYDGDTWYRRSPSAGNGSSVNSGRRLTLPSGGGWVRYQVDYRTGDSTQQVAVFFGALGASRMGQVAIDGAYLHVGWPTDGSTPILYPFVEGSALITYRLTTEDAWFQNHAAGTLGYYGTQGARDSAFWHSGAYSGQVHYGTRETRVSVPKIRTPDDAKRYAVNYFNQHAVASTPSPIRIVDRIRNIRADGLLLVSNLPGGRSGLTLMPVQASHTFDRSGWSCDVERSEERADLTVLLSQIGHTVSDTHETVIAALESMSVSSAAALSTVVVGAIPGRTSVVWKDDTTPTEGSTQIVVDVSETPVAQTALGDVCVWISGAKFRQSLVSVNSAGTQITITAPSNYTFSASDSVEIRYEREA